MLWNVDLWSEIERLRREMNSLFTNVDRTSGAETYPLVNIYDTKDEVILTAELPGMTKEKVNITYSDGVLNIAGNLQPLANSGKMQVVRMERAAGEFDKAIRLPTKVDQNRINASFSNGILTVKLPKSEEAKPKTIAIEAK